MLKILLFAPAAAALLGTISSAHAVEVVSREQDIVELRLGQRIQVDDGACPQGQIKEISGAQLSSAGVTRIARCVPRQGSKR